jgi:hypothetical protein
MQISAPPLKWTIPFAANDSAKVEIPATTSDPTRFSLSLGSPPLTGQPPEVGGVPPQLEDFNGAMNQIARIAYWAMGGGPWTFDSTWATDSNVNGYANGARITTADLRGEWISTVDNNTVNPDTVGTGWVPGYAYGRLTLSGQTGGTVTLTPAQAIKRSFSVTGALTSNLILVVPAWQLDWTVTNATSGAFTVTVKTAAGSGVVIPQNSAPTRVRGDGTNVTQLPENIAAATTPEQGMQFGQATGRLLRRTVYYFNAGVQNISVDGAAGTATGASTFTAHPLTTKIHVRMCGGGGGGGGSSPTGANVVSAGGGGGAGGFAEFFATSGFSSPLTVTLGAGGAGGVNANPGAAGGNTSFGTLCVCNGGGGGLSQNQIAPPFTVASGSGGSISGTVNLGGGNSPGQPGGLALALSNTVVTGGFGGSSGFGGGGGYPALTTTNGGSGGAGAGGGGAVTLAGQGAVQGTGGNGGSGVVVVEEYT